MGWLAFVVGIVVAVVIIHRLNAIVRELHEIRGFLALINEKLFNIKMGI